MEENPKWSVNLKSKEMFMGLPKTVTRKIITLIKQMEISDPNQAKWSHYGKLEKTKYPTKAVRFHCHVKSGKPTYVAVWKVDKENRIIEIEYVGTHEKAPY